MSIKRRIIGVGLIFFIFMSVFAEANTKYTGKKIIFDFYRTDIKNVFKILNEVSGKNFAIDADVLGEVTLCFKEPVRWDHVLDLILRMNRLEKVEEGNIIRIALRKTIEEEDSLRQKKMEKERVIEKSRNHETEFITLNYADASDVISHIEKIITKDSNLNEDQKGKVSIDERTNSIIITDTPLVVSRAKDIIKRLDLVTPQVMIEAKIVETSSSFADRMGVEWGLGVGVQPSTNLLNKGGWLDDSVTGVGNLLDQKVGKPNSGTTAVMSGGTYGYNMAMNFPTTSADYGNIGINFARITGSPLILDATLKVMESEGEGKIISAPKILTLDNEKAKIRQGIEYPYLERDSSGLATVKFKDIDLVLEVTPHITPDKRIAMQIEILKNDIGEKIEGQLSFITKQAKTKLLVNNNDTVVIGGIKKNSNSSSNIGIPRLAKIPILGMLFGSKSKIDRREELIIFIKPNIVQL